MATSPFLHQAPFFRFIPPFLAKNSIPPKWLNFGKVLPLPLIRGGGGGVPTMNTLSFKKDNIQILIFSIVAKLNLTHKKNFKFSFKLYFVLFTYMAFVPLITNNTALLWIMIDVCYFGISITNWSEDILILSNWIRLGNIFWTCIAKYMKYYDTQWRLWSLC